MNSYSKIVRKTIIDFGGYIHSNPDINQFPEELILSHRSMYHSYWNNTCFSIDNKITEKDLVGICFGTLTGTDLSDYAKRYRFYFDKLLLRDPISKLLFMYQCKKPNGFYIEMVTYLNVMIDLIDLIDSGKVIVYPPFYLMIDSIRLNVVNSVERLCCDDIFRDIALTFTDRMFSREKTKEEYKKIFSFFFCANHIDLYGGINLFTDDYIVKTIAQDILTAIVLADITEGTLVSSLRRTTNILSYIYGSKIEKKYDISIPSGLEKINNIDSISSVNLSCLKENLLLIFNQKKYRDEYFNIDSFFAEQEKEIVSCYEIASKGKTIRYIEVPSKK